MAASASLKAAMSIPVSLRISAAAFCRDIFPGLEVPCRGFSDVTQPSTAGCVIVGLYPHNSNNSRCLEKLSVGLKSGSSVEESQHKEGRGRAEEEHHYRLLSQHKLCPHKCYGCALLLKLKMSQ